MAEKILYEKEREEIDVVIADGFQIQSIIDHLNGSDVLFTKDTLTKKLTLGNANARKYASTLLFHQ